MATRTVADIIAAALREINVIGETQAPSAEQGKQSRLKLNGMVELWKQADGVDFGWYETDSSTDTAEVPLYAFICLYSNLAIYCAPQYGRQVSPELYQIAQSSYDSVINIELRNMLDNTDMSHLPQGQGHRLGGYDIETDG